MCKVGCNHGYKVGYKYSNKVDETKYGYKHWWNNSIVKIVGNIGVISTVKNCTVLQLAKDDI